MNTTTTKAKNLGLDHIGKILTFTNGDESVTGRLTSIHHFHEGPRNSLARTEIVLSALGTEVSVRYQGDDDVTFDE